MCTHEQFVHAVRDIALDYLAKNGGSPEQVIKLHHVKMIYGQGARGLRGQTVYNAWKHESHTHGQDTDLIEICALGEESWIQLAGTTLHELGHALAGWGAGHGKDWKESCKALGLRRVHAAGTRYLLANFVQPLRMQLATMPKPSDGAPSTARGGIGAIRHTKAGTARVCSAGVGTRGGTSRGAGSGSRLRKYVCPHGQIIRASTDELNATCGVCGGRFEQPEEAAQPSDPLAALLAVMGA